MQVKIIGDKTPQPGQIYLHLALTGALAGNSIQNLTLESI
jgi:hypothetical protein